MSKSRGMKARVRRAVERLPSPLDERVLSVLRRARAVVKGTPMPARREERPLRAIAERERIGPAHDPVGEDPAERAAVRAGWQLVGAYERLSNAAASRVFGDELEAWFAYAREAMPHLKPWGRPDAMAHYDTDPARLRFRRTMDFVRDGERVFDVGYGRGHLAGLLLRGRKLAAYHGIDIVPWHRKAINEMVAANELEEAEIGLSVGDLYDLTREQVEAAAAGLVICCEVLEHVPDAERALKVLADALPDGAELLFSVPLFGRLEAVWGHLSVFDSARLKAMLDGAGLFAHHVEPVGNIWVFVVASRSPEASVRVREASGRPFDNVSRPLTLRRDFIDVPAGDFTGLGCELAREDEHAVTVAASEGKKAVVTFPARGVEAARLKVTFADFEHVRQVRVKACTARKTLGVWTWVPKPSQVRSGTTKRFALRPGESSQTFHGGRCGDLTKADRVRVELTLASGASAECTLRAAYLPAQ